MLRRRKEDVTKDIPPKEETIIDVELTMVQKKYYRAIYERNHSVLNKVGGVAWRTAFASASSSDPIALVLFFEAGFAGVGGRLVGVRVLPYMSSPCEVVGVVAFESFPRRVFNGNQANSGA